MGMRVRYDRRRGKNVLKILKTAAMQYRATRKVERKKEKKELRSKGWMKKEKEGRKGRREEGSEGGKTEKKVSYSGLRC